MSFPTVFLSVIVTSVICKAPKKDAHHIIERNGLRNGLLNENP